MSVRELKLFFCECLGWLNCLNYFCDFITKIASSKKFMQKMFLYCLASLVNFVVTYFRQENRVQNKKVLPSDIKITII